jgi:hypothetical protein
VFSPQCQGNTNSIAWPSAGFFYHGVYPGGITGEEDDITTNDVMAYEHTVGKSAAWVYFSHNWYKSRAFPLITATWIRERGSIPFIRLMLRDASEKKRNHIFTLKKILKGTFDDDLREWAHAAKTFGTPMFVEYGTEVNGNWFPWNGKWNGGGAKRGYGDKTFPNGPERFRDAFRHIVQLMRNEGASNIAWVFHVNDGDFPKKEWNNFERYYPGDAFVDVLGVSVYGAQTPLDDYWEEFSPNMDAAYQRLALLSSNTPIALLEFGVTKNSPLGNQAEWAATALSNIVNGRWPRLAGFSWWNEFWQNDKHPEHDTTMRVQDNPALANAFRHWVGNATNVLGKML